MTLLVLMCPCNHHIEGEKSIHYANNTYGKYAIKSPLRALPLRGGLGSTFFLFPPPPILHNLYCLFHTPILFCYFLIMCNLGLHKWCQWFAKPSSLLIKHIQKQVILFRVWYSILLMNMPCSVHFSNHACYLMPRQGWSAMIPERQCSFKSW